MHKDYFRVYWAIFEAPHDDYFLIIAMPSPPKIPDWGAGSKNSKSQVRLWSTFTSLNSTSTPSPTKTCPKGIARHLLLRSRSKYLVLKGLKEICEFRIVQLEAETEDSSFTAFRRFKENWVFSKTFEKMVVFQKIARNMCGQKSTLPPPGALWSQGGI